MRVGDGEFFGVAAFVHRQAVGLDHFVAQRVAQALRGQTVRVQLARTGVLGDLLVHQRLRERRRVLLVVAELAEADDVDHHVLVELLAIIQGQLGAEHHRFRIITVDVQHWRFHHLDHIGAVQGRAGVARIAGGEADLVVDHHVHRAARVVTAGLRQGQGFHDHALTSESRVAVHQNGQHAVAVLVLAALLARTHRAFNHRVDDLQVRGVERQGQVNRTTGGGDVGTEALVVLHVTRGQVFHRGVVEFGKQARGRLAQGVDQHVESAAVGHADHDFLHATRTRELNQLVHAGDEALTALQRKALLAHVFRVQVALQAFGRGQLLEDFLFLLGVVHRLAALAFQLLLPPALLALVGRIHILDAHGAAIRLAQRIEQVAQRHDFFAEESVARVENRLVVGIGEAVERGVQLGNVVALIALEGIQIGPTSTHVAVGGDQLLDGNALATQIGVGTGSHDHAGTALLGALGKRIDNGKMGDVAGIGSVNGRHVLQCIEIFAPGL